jgi:hypothetical protein
MYNIRFAALLLLSAPFFMNASCGKKTSSCNDVMCTMIFASVMVQVQNSTGDPIILDELYTIRKKTGEKLSMNQSMAGGGYNVLDDSYTKNLVNTSEAFVFIGMKNGIKVVDEPYTISADCCHIRKDSGKDIIVVP